MSDTILITGGTGFLGMETIATLLAEDEGPDLVLAVRAPDREGAEERVRELLAFGNIVPTGLAAAGRTLFMGQAGPVPHLPEDGKVV